MFLNPCRKCIVRPMCSQTCDDSRRWINIKRIFNRTISLLMNCMAACFVFLVGALLFVKCVVDILQKGG